MLISPGFVMWVSSICCDHTNILQLSNHYRISYGLASPFLIWWPNTNKNKHFYLTNVFFFFFKINVYWECIKFKSIKYNLIYLLKILGAIMNWHDRYIENVKFRSCIIIISVWINNNSNNSSNNNNVVVACWSYFASY